MTTAQPHLPSLKHWLCLLLFGLCAFSTAFADETRTFANPIFPHDWPDPTVWTGDDGRHYTFSTAGTKRKSRLGQFMRSDDLVAWDTIPQHVWSPETLTTLRQYGSEFWAPQVVKINDRWLMYLTCYFSAANSSIVVLSFDAPTFPDDKGKCGPWRFEGLITSSTTNGIIDTIDPFVTEDPQTGKVWMFFGSVGGEYRVELSSDGLALAPEARFVHVAGHTIEQDPTRGRVFEGAYLYYRQGYWYYFVSAGNYNDGSYCVRVARSKNIDGQFIDKQGRNMLDGKATAILYTDPASPFYGPGHNGEIFADKQGQTYMYYHCHKTGLTSTNPGYSPRALMLQRVFWDGDGWPYFKDNYPQGSEVWPSAGVEPAQYLLQVKDSGWATLCLPFDYELPAGMSAYAVSYASDDKVYIDRIYHPQANKPYLINAPAGSYTLTGYQYDNESNLQYGILVGTYSTITAPMGSFVLQDHDGQLGFYRVTTSDILVAANKAYLLLPPGNASAAPALNWDASTSIEPVTGTTQIQTIHSLSGQRLDAPTAGLNIVRCSDGSTHKIIIKE